MGLEVDTPLSLASDTGAMAKATKTARRGLTGKPKEMSAQVPLHRHCRAVRTQARASNRLQTMYSPMFNMF